jgi:Cytochrome c7 and related cytochrome c
MDPNYPGYDGQPIKWVRIHKLADYVKFDHSAHVNRGISCQSCHGQVDQMEVVYQAKPLSMSFCLDCHRAPEQNLRPLEEVYNLKYDAGQYIKDHPVMMDKLGVKTTEDLGLKLKEEWKVNPGVDCAKCHH